MKNIAKQIIKIVFLNLCLITALFSKLELGTDFPKLVLENQYAQKVSIPKKGEVTLLFSFEKGVSTGIQKFLEKQESDFLTQHHMMYISDISSLPKFLVDFFVLPKLKSFNFDVALLYEDNSLDKEENKITVIRLKEHRVVAISFLNVDKLEEFMARPASF